MKFYLFKEKIVLQNGLLSLIELRNTLWSSRSEMNEITIDDPNSIPDNEPFKDLYISIFNQYKLFVKSSKKLKRN